MSVCASHSQSAGWNPSQFVALITGRTRRSATWMLSIARVAVSYTQYTPEYAKVQLFPHPQRPVTEISFPKTRSRTPGTVNVLEHFITSVR